MADRGSPAKTRFEAAFTDRLEARCHIFGQAWISVDRRLKSLRFLRGKSFRRFLAADKSAAKVGAVQTLRVILAIGVVGLYLTGGYVNLPVSNRHNPIGNL
jgi:hypothetical protein